MTDERVEPRVTLVGRGIGTTPESIEQLKKRSREIEKLSRRKPERQFADLLDESAADESEELEREENTPRPKPGLVHPSQKELYGREDLESVVLKG